MGRRRFFVAPSAVVAVAALVAAAVAGCADHTLDRPNPAPGIATPLTVVTDVPRDVDLLVLVDNSSSMATKQDLLRKNFPRLMLALDRFQGGFPNAHIGVVSSDLGAGSFSIETCHRPGGDRGELQAMPRGACTGPADGKRYIEVENTGGHMQANVADVTRQVRNADGTTSCPGREDPSFAPDGITDACDVAEAFGCIAQLGTGGCGFEQHLEAVLRALSPPNTGEGGPNAGFLREKSVLTVLVLGDEDDCSAQRGELFDPSNAGMFGPLQSFRCVEFGYHCQVNGVDSCAYGSCPQTIPRAGGVALADCRSDDATDVADKGQLWLYPPSRYVDFFRTIRAPGRFIYADIGADFRPGDTLSTEFDHGSGAASIAPSCFCSGGGCAGDPAVRRREVSDALTRQDASGATVHDGIFGQDVNASVCADDYSPALSELGHRLHDRLKFGCVPNPLVSAGQTLIERPAQAECTVQEAFDGGSQTLPACAFAGAQPGACPAGGGGGAVTNAPCWFFCDSASLGENACDALVSSDGTRSLPGLGYDHRWQFRVCRDGSCNPDLPAPSGGEAHLSCLTCSLDADTCVLP